MEKLDKQQCPICMTKNLTLTQDEMDIPFFGRTYVFNMHCSSCHYNKSDVECEDMKDPTRITFEVNSEEDMKVRVVKSGEATIKIPALKISVEGGPNGEGYVSNIEGIAQLLYTHNVFYFIMAGAMGLEPTLNRFWRSVPSQFDHAPI